MAATELVHVETAAVLKPAPELSILIVTWNSERWIERCLNSIPAACEGLSYEVVLYDNSSADRTLQFVSDDIRSIASQSNDGFAGAINRAIASVRGPYVFLLNPDCELAPRCLALLVDFLRTHPGVAAAAQLLEDGRGNSQREFQLRRFPTLLTFATEVLAIDKLFPSNPITASYRYRDLDLTHPQVIDQPAAAALLIRREVFDEVGALDEQFFPAWFEDVDYCRRLAKVGKHFGGASLEHVPFGRFIDLWYRNMWRYARKWFTPAQAEGLRWIIMTGMLLRLVPALAGIAHPEVGRRAAVDAYAGVLRTAFARWDDSSPSS